MTRVVPTPFCRIHRQSRALATARLLDGPDDEVGLGRRGAQASELGGDLAAMIGRVVDHVAKDGPEGQ